ncbi:PH domain-containing protein [Agrococcus sp. ARC_14]|uniref:PH domain-containing protein n=1 Tax=Agrococcus sp. ARC_14 TaxID=2919927 RepID=UPI001F0653DC|nr:PH domain-containing protein [Agrococcus sp. ARC_14]
MTLHSRVNRGVAIACWALLVVLGGLLALQSQLQGVVATIIVAAWLAYAAYVAMWAPALVVDAHGSEIRNPLRTIRVAWDALIHVDTKFALTLFTPGRSWSVWCAPQASALIARRKARRFRDDRDPRDPRSPLDAGMRIGDLPGTESGDAAALVRDRWDRLANGSADAEAIAVPVTVHWGRVAALIAGPVLAATVPLLL